MTKPNDGTAFRAVGDGRPKKAWRAPKMMTCLPVAQTANDKTNPPSDATANPNVS